MAYRLLRRDEAPPGGFAVTHEDTQCVYEGGSFSGVARHFQEHMSMNGVTLTIERVEEMVEEQTADRLYNEGLTEWLHPDDL